MAIRSEHNLAWWRIGWTVLMRLGCIRLAIVILLFRSWQSYYVLHLAWSGLGLLIKARLRHNIVWIFIVDELVLDVGVGVSDGSLDAICKEVLCAQWAINIVVVVQDGCWSVHHVLGLDRKPLAVWYIFDDLLMPPKRCRRQSVLIIGHFPMKLLTFESVVIIQGAVASGLHTLRRLKSIWEELKFLLNAEVFQMLLLCQGVVGRHLASVCRRVDRHLLCLDYLKLPSRVYHPEVRSELAHHLRFREQIHSLETNVQLNERRSSISQLFVCCRMNWWIIAYRYNQCTKLLASLCCLSLRKLLENPCLRSLNDRHWTSRYNLTLQWLLEVTLHVLFWRLMDINLKMLRGGLGPNSPHPTLGFVHMLCRWINDNLERLSWSWILGVVHVVLVNDSVLFYLRIVSDLLNWDNTIAISHDFSLAQLVWILHVNTKCLGRKLGCHLILKL